MTTESIRAAELLVLAAANDRFQRYMTDKGLQTEESVIGDLVLSRGPAPDLIRAVAKWRIATRDMPSDKSNAL